MHDISLNPQPLSLYPNTQPFSQTDRTIECGFTLKLVRDMIITCSQYTQYFDKIFLVFHSHDEAKRIFCCFNSRNPNFRHTMETEV